MKRVIVRLAQFEVLDKPLSLAAIKRQFKKDGKVEGIVRIGLSEMHCDFEGFLDLLSEKLIGSDLLQETDYLLVGASDGEALIEVWGDPTGHIECRS